MIHEPSQEGSFTAGKLATFSASRRLSFTAWRIAAPPTSRPGFLPRPENINRHSFIPYARVNAGCFHGAVCTACRYTRQVGKSAAAS